MLNPRYDCLGSEPNPTTLGEIEPILTWIYFPTYKLWAEIYGLSGAKSFPFMGSGNTYTIELIFLSRF